MQQQIDNIQKQIDELKRQLTNSGMSIELRENIRNEVIKDVLTGTSVEQIILTGEPQTIEVTKRPTKFIIIKWRGKEYNVPYYETI